ncbi:hypothetical protein BM613_06115 [Sulfoacidibacillus thermotolerans]|uniref:ATP synthase subunit I n=1 Tax=Sulfoacidibacillus thermotolerans TaxID=1765684 RepID=A0A2U3D9Q6_SULT2|nr:hypothetical protein BM613_06115 [Sulfoacidibacillus thermotolerans]
MERLQARLRVVQRIGIGIIALSAVARFVFRSAQPDMNGLLLGELGGAYVYYSMIRQGHLRDGLQGKALFASGMLGMVTRFVVLIAVMVVAVKSPGVNPFAALVGYLLGFVLLFFGLYGYAKNRRITPGGK